jgi:D-hydroxyproline dehydrogenase subunit beta
VNSRNVEVLVIGAGIVGLAHAWIAARSGRSVAVLERRPAALGASIANFGLLWPIGQPAGSMLQLALESRTLWIEMFEETGIPSRRTGSLHLACRDDEQQVAMEFAALAPALGYRCSWLDRADALACSPALRRDTVLGALKSETEIMVDPREVLRRLSEFLAQHYGVSFEWNCTALHIDPPRVRTTRGEWYADRILLCNGADLDLLYPELFANSGLVHCRLQMLRTRPQPAGWSLGPALAGGLTFRFYPSFTICSSLGALRSRIARESPEYDHFGIHTMVSQTTAGELTLGDSHQYGSPVTPFNSDEIDGLILRHLDTYVRVPGGISVSERWHGVYAKHPEQPYLRLQPTEGIEIITGLGGAGMTLSFGVARETLYPSETKEQQ